MIHSINSHMGRFLFLAFMLFFVSTYFAPCYCYLRYMYEHYCSITTCKGAGEWWCSVRTSTLPYCSSSVLGLWTIITQIDAYNIRSALSSASLFAVHASKSIFSLNVCRFFSQSVRQGEEHFLNKLSVHTWAAPRAKCPLSTSKLLESAWRYFAFEGPEGAV